jgi:DNA-binding NarL/FixJ family response regulator
VVDDNREVGTSLERWFTLSKDFRWAGWLPGPQGLDELLVEKGPDVALIDWDLPGVDTGALLTRVTAKYGDVAFAVLSAHLDPAMIRAALAAGACGYLSKGQAPVDLAVEVRMLAEGKRVLSPQVRAALGEDEALGVR